MAYFNGNKDFVVVISKNNDGGASVASCTLEFAVDNYGDLYVAYTKSDGTARRLILPPNEVTTIDGIMCGSMIALYSRDGSYFSPEGLLPAIGSFGSCDLYSAPTSSGTYRLAFDRS